MTRQVSTSGIARWVAGVVGILILAALIGARLVYAETENTRTSNRAATPVATPPVASDSLDGDPLTADPLDGDPLDGKPPADPTPPRGSKELEVVRSGRPTSAPASLAAYDGDPATTWDPGKETKDAWVWLDLGQARQVREVRWLARGSGAVDVAVSNDRERWHDIGHEAVHNGWATQTLSDDARYVRLTLLPDDSGDRPQLADVTVYGDDAKSVDQKQDAKSKSGKKDRKSAKSGKNGNGGKTDSGSSKNADTGDGGGKRKSGARSSGQIQASAARGETSCKGKRARCTAQEGRIEMDGACGAGSSCTIDIQADGGSAVCDASGGENTKAGQGEGKSGGNGGRCEAVANGGAISIGDINP
jgi:hypothetical protein